MNIEDNQDQSLDGRTRVKRLGASIPELSLEFGLSESVLYGLANRNELPGGRRLGKRIVVHRATFEEWLQTGLGI